MPVLFCGLSVPISLFMWLGNVALSKFWSSDFEGELYGFQCERYLGSTNAKRLSDRVAGDSAGALALLHTGALGPDDCGSAPEERQPIWSCARHSGGLHFIHRQPSVLRQLGGVLLQLIAGHQVPRAHETPFRERFSRGRRPTKLDTGTLQRRHGRPACIALSAGLR